jgi:hypothetical protein
MDGKMIPYFELHSVLLNFVHRISKARSNRQPVVRMVHGGLLRPVCSNFEAVVSSWGHRSLHHHRQCVVVANKKQQYKSYYVKCAAVRLYAEHKVGHLFCV